MNKTFDDLGYKAGDTVRCTRDNPYFSAYKVDDVFTLKLGFEGSLRAGSSDGSLGDWELVCDPSDLTWGDMTHEQQGALLLAHHKGKTIEVKSHASGRWADLGRPMWKQNTSYRIKPKHVPVVVHHNLYSGAYASQLGVLTKHQYTDSTYVLTYDTEDGVPVCSSVKLSQLT
jgi:hypothetical protein